MSRIADILRRVRVDLHDTNKTRWSDEDLLAFLDEGQKDIAKQTNIVKDTIAIPLRFAEHTYTLPENTLKVLRCDFDNQKLPLKPTDYMDQRGTIGKVLSELPRGVSSSTGLLATKTQNRWQTATTSGNILCVIYDKMKRRNIRVWPTPISNSLEETQTIQESITGFAYGIDNTSVPTFGTISDLINTNEGSPQYPDGPYGIIVEVIAQSSLAVHRSRYSKTVDSLDSELEVDPFCDAALKYYTIAQAFRNDIKEENRAVSNENLILYTRELDLISRSNSEDMTTSDSLETIYNGMG